MEDPMPLSGKGHQLIQEDVVEGDPRWRNPMTFNNLNHHLNFSTREELENKEENNANNIAEDEMHEAENGLYYHDEDNEENNKDRVFEDDELGDLEDPNTDEDAIVPRNPRDFHRGM